MDEHGDDAGSRVAWTPIAAFIGIAFLLAWLIALPLWLSDGLESPLARLLVPVMMLTPGVAAVIVVAFIEKPASKAFTLGMTASRPLGRWVGFMALGLLAPIGLTLIALVVGSWLGQFPADFFGLSGFQQLTEEQLADSGINELPVSVEILVVAQFVNILIAALILNVLPALGEEVGWRGWLLPKLLPLGPWPAIAASGVIWGLWHAPVILLGHNYPGAPGWLAMLAMIAFCTIVGGLLGWLRIRSDSVWPAALAHSALNASGSLFLLFIAKDETIDPLRANITGWSGWLVPLALLVALVAFGRFARTPSRARRVPAP
ncbi:CPBP family intramembrane glutamic endopeptidase [Microbacterium keratanolyticum]